MNTDEYPKLTKGEKFIFDWQYKSMGGFKTALINAIRLSDSENRAKLRLGFPEEVDAFNNFTQTKGWWTALSKRMGVEE